MVVVSCQVLGINVEVMVSVQLPELAVDDIEVFVGEVVCDLVDVVLFFQEGQGLQKVTPAQLSHSDAARPGAVHHIKYPLDHLFKKERYIHSLGAMRRKNRNIF